jgi:3-oxoacyl-[acyl-carrier-protein] synthase-1
MDVIATGMVSSLGYDVRTACAAARAGLTRSTELPFMVREDDNSPGLAIGHPVPLFGGGFDGDARLIRLLEGALRDLNGRVSLDRLLSARTGFYLALPAANREHEGINLIPEEQRGDYIDQLGEPTTIDEFARARSILTAALRMAGFPARLIATADGVKISLSGHTAVVDLYERAQADLRSGRIGVAVVAAVDSLVTATALSWLQATYRLKSAECPAGLSPGEAAAVVVLASAEPSGQTEAVRARIARVATMPNSTRFLAAEIADGAGQFEVLRALTSAIDPSSDNLWLIVDQNGEVFRAADWGRTLIRYRAIAPINAEPTIWYPAMSFGDTGAAAGAIATCTATRAHEAGYAPSTHAIVMTNSDGPTRGGCVVSVSEE